jgi:hypothetical protein
MPFIFPRELVFAALCAYLALMQTGASDFSMAQKNGAQKLGAKVSPFDD